MIVATLAFALPALAQEYRPRIEPASDEGEAAIAAMEVPEGFTAKLWAAEPRLANPVAMYVDEKGEVYVAESFRIKAGVEDIRDHMDWLDDDVAARTVEDRLAYLQRRLGDDFASYSVQRERVRWLADTDGDGRADADSVFADSFGSAADGIAAGVLSWGGRVWFTCMPSLWRLRDADGDHRADELDVLSTGYGIRFALYGHDLHGLRIGPDGKLYFSCGDRGFSVPLPDGKRLENPFCGAVLRCNLDGSDLEIFATGLRNPQELVFDENGELWTVDNNSDGGDQARLVHVVEGMDAGWRQAYQWLTEPELRGPWNDERLWKPWFEGQAAYIVPPLANICDGPSGLTYEPGTAFGAKWANHFFVCDFRGQARSSGIQTFTVRPRGASFELATYERFLWGTLATDCDFGPDGALWWSDWVDGWATTGKGRIYRLAASERDEASAADTLRLLQGDWTAMSDANVRGTMGHADQRVRFAAQFELVRRRKSHLLYLLATDPMATKLARLHAVWGLGMLDRPSVLAAVDDEDEHVRAAAIRVAGEMHRDGSWQPDDASSPGPMLAALDDPSPVVQREAALALGKGLSLLDREAVGIHERLYSKIAQVGETDPALRHALIQVLVRLGDQGMAWWGPFDDSALTTEATADYRFSLADAASHPSADVRVAVVVALRRLKSGKLAAFLADRDERVVAEAARAIYDVPIEAAYPELAALVARDDLKSTAIVRRALNAAFRLGGEENAKALASFAAREDSDELHRWEALELLHRWPRPPGRDMLTGEWRPLPEREAPFLPRLVAEMHAKGIGSAPPRVARAWIRLARESRAAEVGLGLLEMAKRSDVDVSVRSDAIEAAAELRAEGLEEALAVLVDDADGAVRAAALRAVNAVAPERAFPLVQKAAVSGSRDERRVAFAALAKLPDLRADDLLARELSRLSAGFVPAEVALDLVLAAEQRDTDVVAHPLAELLARREGDPALAPFLDSLYGGDSARGRALFRGKTELQCLRCHVADGDGGKVGPDLRGVGRRATRLELLESICEPNRGIVRGYDGVVLVLEDDSVVAGIVASEDGETVTLRTSQDELVEVERASIRERRPDLSAMPQDLAKHVTREDMRDLIEYLARLEQE
jgi:quinoprotein glucose dehydrogenase